MANCLVPYVGHAGASSSGEQNNNARESQAVEGVRGRMRPRGDPVVAADRPANPGNQFNLQDGVRNATVREPGVANVGGGAIAQAPVGIPAAQAGALGNVNPVGAHNGGVAVQAAQVPTNLAPAPAPPPALAQPPAGPLVPTLAGPPAAPLAPLAPLAPALALPYFDIDAGLSGPPLRRSEVGPFF